MTYTDSDLIAVVQHRSPVEDGDKRYTVNRSNSLHSLTVWAQTAAEAKTLSREYLRRIIDVQPSGVVSVVREH